MKKYPILIASLFALALIVVGMRVAEGQVSCPVGEQCGWINVTNVTSFGVPWSASSQQFENVQMTKDRTCVLRGYSYARGDSWATRLAKWSNCNGEYHVNWTGSDWSSRLCNKSLTYVTDVYCARPVPTNRAPSIMWSENPTSAACNASYRIEAIGRDEDGNLASVSISKDGASFANEGGGDGSVSVSGNPSSDSGPDKITYTAWATDAAGAKSNTLTHTVDIAACSVPNTDPVGGFTASCSGFSGSAVDGNTPMAPVGVHFYVDGPAGVGSFVGATNATPNYYLPTPNSLKTGANRTIYAYAIDTQGGNNPQIGQATINCTLPSNPAPTVTVGVTPSNLPSGGGSVNITWTATNADSCTASGAWNGSKDRFGGSESTNVSSTSTFTLTCTGPGGTGNGSATVTVAPTNVTPPANNTASLSLSKTCAAPNEAVTFTSNAGGSNVVSHIIEKDSNQDGVFGTEANFGSASGSRSHTTSFGPGTYDFRTVVNGSTYSSNVRLTVSGACGGAPGTPGTPGPAPISATLSGPSCARPGQQITVFATVSGSGINSKTLEKDTNADGVYGQVASWGSGPGAHSYSETTGGSYSGVYSFKVMVNGSERARKDIPVSNGCITTPGNPGVPGGGVGGGGGGGGGPLLCTDPNASNVGQPLPCRYPGFTLSVSPSTVKAKSLAGYSGITEREILVSVNPVNGMNAPISISIDPNSIPASTKPEFSFGGGVFSANPSATMTYDGSFYRNGGIIYVPILVRFNGVIEKNRQYNLVIRGTGLAGGRGSGTNASATAVIDSRPLYPGYADF